MNAKELKELNDLRVEVSVLRKAFKDAMDREDRHRRIISRMAKRIARRWKR